MSQPDWLSARCAVAVCAIVWFAGGCSGEPRQQMVDEDVPDAPEEAGPGALDGSSGRVLARPEAARPGSSLDLHFPDELPRGLGFVLERESSEGDGYERVAVLRSDAAGEDPVSWSWGDEGPDGGIDDIGVGGAGPDTVVLPRPIEAGIYRICPLGSEDDSACTVITVTE